MTAHTNRDHPIVILVRGMPGSGKSYLTEALSKELQKSVGQDGVVVLDPDATDYESEAYKDHVKSQIAEGVDPALHAYRFLRAQAYDGIAARKIVIWNQAFTNLEIFNKMVGRLRDHAELHHVKLPILVVEIEIDPAKAKERILKRQRTEAYGGADDQLIQKIDDYNHVSFAGEGFDTVVVQGEDDASKSASTILKVLENKK